MLHHKYTQTTKQAHARILSWAFDAQQNLGRHCYIMVMKLLPSPQAIAARNHLACARAKQPSIKHCNAHHFPSICTIIHRVKPSQLN